MFISCSHVLEAAELLWSLLVACSSVFGTTLEYIYVSSARFILLAKELVGVCQNGVQLYVNI